MASCKNDFLCTLQIILPVAWEWLKAYLSSPRKTIQDNKIIIKYPVKLLIPYQSFQAVAGLFLPTECPSCGQQDCFLMTLNKSRVGDVGPDVMVYLTCAVIGLGGRGVIKTCTEVAARVRLYMLTSDLTSLVPP